MQTASAARRGRVAATCAALALALAAAPCRRRQDADVRPVVATVGGAPIYAADVARAAALQRLEPDDAGAPPAASQLALVRAQLDDLVARRLLVQAAEKAAVVVTSDEVDQAFARAHGGWQDGAFEALLKERDITATELKAELRELLLVRKYLRDAVFARLAVTDQEIEADIAQHPEQLERPEEVRARHLVVKTREQAQSIAAEIDAGLAFEEAAGKYSLSPEGRNGGDLGLFARGVMPAAFDATCFALPPGRRSEVVESPYGYHLFKVLERHPAGHLALPQVRERVEARLRNRKQEAAQAATVARLRAATPVVVEEDRLAQLL